MNVVVAVLMKHLEESNSNAAAEDAAVPDAPGNDGMGGIVSQQVGEMGNGNGEQVASPPPPLIPTINVTEADSDASMTKHDSDEKSTNESDAAESTQVNPEVTVTTSDATTITTSVATNETDPLSRSDKLYCQVINRDDSILAQVSQHKCDTMSRQKKLEKQATLDECGRIMQTHIIYEESSDSDNQQIRVGKNERNVKRMCRKMRNTRSHLLHGMRIDSIEDHEGSSSPPYDDTRASESATSLNEFYIEYESSRMSHRV